jgi:hypothetical protein
MKLDVTKAAIAVGRCRHISYSILGSRTGIGVGTDLRDGDFAENWRTIAVELRPKTTRKERCLTNMRVRIVEFSIPVSNVCHADIAMFKNRADFNGQHMSGWGTWGKRDCL